MAALQSQIDPARLAVVETVYHQQHLQQPTSVESRFTRKLTQDEQPFIRTGTVGEKWTPIEFGWVGSASMLVLKNEQGKFNTVQPTEEEIEEEQAKVLLLTGDPGSNFCWKVRPGESLRAEPSDLKLFMRCLAGQARYTLVLIPS